jgi:hypothetical protein
MSQSNQKKQEKLRKLIEEQAQLTKELEQDRETYKQLVAERVPQVVAELVKLETLLQATKASVYESFRDIIELKAEVYGIKDDQQTHTFSFEEYTVKIGHRVMDGWDDTVSSGIAKVKRYITSLATDEKTETLVSAVLSLLQQDKKGNLNASRVMELRKIAQNLNDAEFNDGVNIIIAAHSRQRSTWFVEASQPGQIEGIKKPIALSLSTVDFPADFNFDFLKEPQKTEQDSQDEELTISEDEQQ